MHGHGVRRGMKMQGRDIQQIRMYTHLYSTATAERARRQAVGHAMTAMEMQLDTSLCSQQETAAETMQANFTSPIIMEESAQTALMTACGAQEIPNHPIQAMQNGGVTSMNGLSAKTLQCAARQEESPAQGFQEAFRGLPTPL